MLNVTVVGTIRDDSGHLQSGVYTVEYKDRDIIVGPITTDNSQISFNIGDHSHLGCNGTMRNGEVVYVNFENTAGTKFARRIHTHSGEDVVLLETISKYDWGLSSVLTVNEVSAGVYRLESACTGNNNIFRVYICSNSIFENDPSNYNWKLARTVTTSDDSIDVSFVKSIKVRIEVETEIDGHVGQIDQMIMDVDSVSSFSSKIFMIEWE